MRRGALLWAGAALLAGPGPALAASLAPLPQTGQTACYGLTGDTLNSCVGTGQDGDTQAGVPWPAGRFKVNGDATVTDALTGLAWTRDANAPGPLSCDPGVKKTWPQALSYVKCLNSSGYQGHSDWRLPNIKELWSLFDAGQGTIATWLSNNHFNNVQIGLYKSSTASPGNLTGTPLAMNFGDGSVQGIYYNNLDYVWPVRSSPTAGEVALPRTGTTLCYDWLSSSNTGSCAATGQDGELLQGVPWSSATRFTAAAATVDDNLTGLQWAKQGRVQSFSGCSGGPLDWGGALQFVRCLNDNQYLGKSDWRLPNLNELSSLSNAGSDTYGWLTTTVGFTLDQNAPYWSSSTYLQPSTLRAFDSAWTVLIGQNGVPSRVEKTNAGYALPVRTQQAALPQKVGDVNRDGAIDIKDALQVYQLYLAPEAPFEPLADVAPLGSDGKPGGSGSIDLGDVITILRYLVLKGTPGAVQW
jgi:hypothetical protein